MGEQTTEFASRFAIAVAELARVARGEADVDAARLPALVREALDAVAAVYETGTSAVRNWPEQRARVLDRIAAVRAALARSGVDPEVRRLVRQLVETIESRPGGRA